MIAFKCSCGARFKVSDEKAGKKAKCPRCAAILTIPMPIAVPQETDIYDLADDGGPPAGQSTLLASQSAVAPAPVRGATRPPRAAPEAAPQPAPTGPSVRCPSCTNLLPGGSKICVQCGVKIPSGRPVLTSRGMDQEELEEKAEKVIRPVSWLIGWGIYPIYSEAEGRSKPYTTWTIAAITIVASVVFLALDWKRPATMRSAKNLLLWCGNAPPSADHLRSFYLSTNYGDTKAFLAKVRELQQKDDEEKAKKGKKPTAAKAATRRPPEPSEGPEGVEVEDIPIFGKMLAAMELSAADDKNILAAHQALPPDQQCFGTYSAAQLFTNAFLHGGLLHLAGNMLFLFVLGTRVNAAIGNIATVVLYAVLAVLASLAHKISADAGMPMPALGASGAVMGMAGMYIVLFPIQKIHLVAWWRWGLWRGFRLSRKVFAVPGIFVVLFYIFFDVLFTILAVETGTAHWAHIGGLIAGMVLALLLLATRLAHTGGDILSLTLGKAAWALIGTPHAHARRRGH